MGQGNYFINQCAYIQVKGITVVEILSDILHLERFHSPNIYLL